MQQTGTLKKRKRRNIAKVTGLADIPYSEGDDSFDWKTMFRPSSSDGNRHAFSYSPEQDFRTPREGRLGFVSPPSSSYKRVTRNPAFHNVDVESGEGSVHGKDHGIGSNSRNGSGQMKDPLSERQHFLDKSCLRRLRQILWLGMFSGAFPWKWNSATHQIDKWSPTMEKLCRIPTFLFEVQSICITMYHIYNFADQFRHDLTSYRVVFMNLVNIVVYLSVVLFYVNIAIYKEQTREYINTLFKFNKDFMQKYVYSLDGYKDGGRIVINVSIPVSLSQVPGRISLFLTVPCLNSYLFSFICPKPWYWLIFPAIHEFCILGQVLSNYSLYQWIIVAHANSVEFWLRESHRNNDSDFTSDELRQPKQAMETYRALQVLTTCFNDCMAPLAIPLLKGHVLGCLIPCGFVFIRSVNHYFVDEFPGILSFPICIINTVGTGFCTLSVASQVYDLASGFVDSWSRTRNKDFRRTLMSCAVLKVKVGRLYYMTVATTITFFKSATDYIIDCIITFP